MKVFGFSILLSVFCLQLPGQVIPYQELSRPAPKPGTDLYLYYSSPSDEVIVENGKITHRSKNYRRDTDDPYSATSTNPSKQSVAESIPLNGHQLSGLKQRVNNSGFFQDQPRRHRASSDAVQYELRIRVDGKEQRMAFSSNPSYAGAPPSFEHITDYLWRVVTEVEQ